MNEKDIRYFCAAYKYRNISHAAEKIYITPQGLSKAIQRLENELSVPLFERTQTGIRPTAYADVLYKRSQDVIEVLSEIKAEVLNPGIQKNRELIAAFTLGVIDYVGVDFIQDFHKLYPDIQLSIIQNPDARVDDMLKNGQAEIGIIAGPIDTTIYDGQLFTVHKHCLVINQEHPLAQKTAIAYQDLNGIPIALEGREFCPYHNNMNRFLRNGVLPSIVLETTEIESTHKFASLNNGIGISVDFCAFAHPYENTVIRPFEDPDCTWETYLVTKRGLPLSVNAKLFREYALRWLAEHKTSLFHWDFS